MRGPMKFFSIFAAFFLLFSAGWGVEGTALAQQDKDWTWKVLVVAPEDGWEDNVGRSIRAALSWHEAEIDESGKGVRGHDLRFVYLPLMDEGSTATAPLPVDKYTVALLSFAAPEVDRILIGRAAALGIHYEIGRASCRERV